MPLEITEDTMTVVLEGEVIATGTRTDCGWHVTTCPPPTRPQLRNHSPDARRTRPHSRRGRHLRDRVAAGAVP